MNKVNIVYGGSSALWGSGNVGGALLLENDAPVFDSGRHSLFINGGMGSFGQYMGGIKGCISTKRWYFSADVFAQAAQNNFVYSDNSGGKVNMSNSRLQSDAAMAEAAYKIGTNNVLSLVAWYQQYDRQIPPSLSEASSVKEQMDGSLRTVLNWNKVKRDNTWYVRESFIRDEINYTDAAIELKSDNIVYQYYGEIGWKRQFHEYGQLLLFSPVQVAWLPQPDGTKQQNRAALAGAYDLKKFNDRFDVAINARGEIINSQSIFLPGADASFAITRWLTIRANVQRTYRTPTLNELYYFPGGNTSLKPEQGWNEDAGYTVKGKLGSFSFYHDLSVFNRNIHDWIYWTGGAIWTPHNIAEVHSRGVETENNIEYGTGKWKFHIGVNTSYVLATTVSSYIYNDGSIGKQIPYTPRYNGQMNIGFSFRQLYVNYNHTYTGYRFTTTDESAYILPYETGNMQLMYNTSIERHSIQLIAACNNIWNRQYEVVADRPMPGINWQAGFKVGLF